MDYNVLSAFVNDKKGKQAYLTTRLEELEDQNLDLLSNIGGKMLINIGSALSGTIFLVLALAMFVLGVISLVEPEQVMKELPFKETPELMAKKKLQEYENLLELNEFSRRGLINKFKLDIEQERLFWLRVGAGFMILLSFYMLMKRKQIRRLRKVRKQIIDANKATLEIIEEFKTMIQEEDQEIQRLERLVG